MFEPVRYMQMAVPFFAALIAVFGVGLVVGFIAGLIIGNTEIAHYFEGILETFQLMLDDAYYGE